MIPAMNHHDERDPETRLVERIALAIHLNTRLLPRRKKGVAIDYSEYDFLARAVLDSLKLAGWRFKQRPPSERPGWR